MNISFIRGWRLQPNDHASVVFRPDSSQWRYLMMMARTATTESWTTCSGSEQQAGADSCKRVRGKYICRSTADWGCLCDADSLV